jgi:hypothetical protein
MKNLHPIFSKMIVEGASGDTGNFLEKLEACVCSDIHQSVSLIHSFPASEIKSLTAKMDQATSSGTLVRFFNSTDDASSLKSHNDNLDRIINEATVSRLVIDCMVPANHPLFR